MQLGYGWNSIKLEVYSHVLKAVNYRKMYEKWQYIIVSLRIVTIVIHKKKANKQPFSFPFC